MGGRTYLEEEREKAYRNELYDLGEKVDQLVLDEQENGPMYYQPNSADKPPGKINIFGTAGALIANDDRDMTWERVRCPPQLYSKDTS